MAEDAFPLQKYWEYFLASAPEGSYRIWLHCRDYFACARRLLESNELDVVLVPTVASEYCFDLVSPMAQLARFVLTSTSGDYDKLVFLSASALPVKSFTEVQDVLLRDDSSDMCLKKSQKDRVLTDGTDEFALIRHTQWVVLTRRHAVRFGRRWLQVPRPKEHRRVDLLVRDAERAGDMDLWLLNISCKVLQNGRHRRGTLCKGCGPTDGAAVFASIFGAVPLHEFPYDDDWSTLKESTANDWTARCHTFASFNNRLGNASIASSDAGGAAETDAAGAGAAPAVSLRAKVKSRFDPAQDRIAGMIRHIFEDPNTTVHGHDSTADFGSHPWTFNALSENSFKLLRCSPFLFARKFSDDIDLPFFQDVLDQENLSDTCDSLDVKMDDEPVDTSAPLFTMFNFFR